MVAASLRGRFSSNSSTNRFNAAVAAMGPEKFSPQGKQALENWLRSARRHRATSFSSWRGSPGRLVTRVLPESLRLALTLGNKGEFTDVEELFEKARIGIRALQAQFDAFGSYAQAVSAPSTQQARKAKRTDSSGSKDSQRLCKQPRGDQPSRLGTGLPVVPGKSEATVLALVRAGKCANCEEKGHHTNVCLWQVPAFVAAAVGLPSPSPAQAAALPSAAHSSGCCTLS